MSSAKQQVLDMIKKKRAKNKAYKNRVAKRMGPYGIVIEFIKAMEIVVQESESHMEFETSLEREATLLYDRFRAIDPEVHVQVVWNNELTVDTWQDLQVEGVKITWSKFWRGKHPLDEGTKYIDVAQLF